MGLPRSPQGRARLVHERLKNEYEAICELDHGNAFELLVATILSAQCTDARVNKTTPDLFRRFPTPLELAAADPIELEEMVRSTGFYKSKARNLLKMANQLLDDHSGEVPKDLEKLVRLGGVGRKTANVIRSVAFKLPGLPVDTHVGRLSRRLGLTNEEDPVKVELTLNPMVPQNERGEFAFGSFSMAGRCVSHAVLIAMSVFSTTSALRRLLYESKGS